MNKLFGLLLLALAFLAPGLAQAATCFWVGGTGTWDTTNTASWDASSGGAGGDCAATGGVPKQATDIATFDASSGGGVVTVDATMSGVSMAQITAGTFTGTLDFSVNNPSMTFTTSLNFSGTGARKFLMGSGTFTLTGNATVFDLGTVTNLDGTSDFATASYVINASTTFVRTFAGGGRSYGPVTISANSGRGQMLVTGSNTFASFSIAAPNYMAFANGTTQTVTTAPTWTGTSSDPLLIFSNSSTVSATIALGSGTLTCDWCGLNRITRSGGTAGTATNSMDYGNNSLITITPPSVGGGGGGRIIGG